MGSEAIIGVMDTGIWPESKVFDDQGLGPIPERWRGKCESGEQFNATTHCNNKLIGAKYYVDGLLAEMGETFKTITVREFKSNRDALGHGTHTSTIAAGSFVANVSFYGLARGMVRGGAPRARIASYKAYDDAIHDGVDVLSVSISGDLPEDTEVDKLDFVGAFHAVSKGIPVVSSASNEGPKAQTVANAAPWLLTVAATTLDRSFPTKITLGNKQTLFGESLFTGPEISAGLAYWDSESDDSVDVKGRIVLVFDFDTIYQVAKKGVAGVICAEHPDDIVDRCHAFPCIYTDYELGTDILQYIRTTRSPTARISGATTLTGLPATTKVAAFSSRGPNSVSPAILKPDIAAPGVSILAALSPLDPSGHNGFGLASGTSMSTPVVSGIIALLKSLHPDWSPAAFRSALVTTAWRTSPSGEPIFAEGSNKKLADPFDYGGGLVNPGRAAYPGLIYDMGIEDYINYMCSKGYNDSSISRVLGKKTKCPTPKPSILDINLPSITIPNLEEEVTLTRTVTNVGPIKSVYKAVIESPLGIITLDVNPTTLVFSSADKKVLSFTVKAKTSHKVNTGYFFGSLTWIDGVHDVKIPVSVQTRIMIKP
ncbi:Subtilase family protein [Raphanus sativus]|nr:Subtilase family protein [Raphanus sativus]